MSKFDSAEERRAYHREWYAQNKHRESVKNQKRETRRRLYQERKEWFAELKKNLVCKKCGIDDFRVLDFHHRDPTEKDSEVSNMIARTTKEKILEEIEKCDVLCANCHRIEHFKDDCGSNIP